MEAVRVRTSGGARTSGGGLAARAQQLRSSRGVTGDKGLDARLVELARGGASCERVRVGWRNVPVDGAPHAHVGG